MKIAHILNELRFSGAEVLLTSAADILQSAGPTTVICTGEQEGDYAQNLRAAGYRVLHLPYRKNPWFIAKMIALLRRERFELVHIHPERASFRYAIACATLKIPHLRTVHNTFEFGAAGRLRRIVTRRLSSWTGTRYVACSPAVQRVEMVQYGVSADLILNWFDPTRVPVPTPERRIAARASLGLSDDALFVVSIANESPAKNLEALIDGVGLAALDVPRLRHVHCGAVGGSLREKSRSLSPGLVEFAGTVSDVGLYLSACDIFASTSFNEGGPLVLIEAAAAGTKCITTRVGLAEMFDGMAGVTFIEPSAQSLAAELKAAARQSPVERGRLGNELAQVTRERFGPEAGSRKYLNLYRSLSGGSALGWQR